MPRPRFPRATSCIRLVCMLLCYCLAIPFSAFIPKIGITSASTTTPTKLSKTNTPHKAHQTTQTQQARWRDNELLARFKQNISQSEVDSLLQANGAQRVGQLRGQSGIERLRLAAGTDPEAAAINLRSSQKVDLIEPNYLITADQAAPPTAPSTASTTPNDPRYSEQWALRNTGQSGGYLGSDINAESAWGVTTGSKQTVIAIIDSGVDFTHRDLRTNEWDNTLEHANNDDDDNNGFTNDLHGWDFLTNTAEIKDEQGHGTAIAGIIAAEGNNATGTTGIMWHASLMSLRVLDNTGTGDVAAAIEAIDYAVHNGAQVINCSWGTDDASLALREAINWAARRGVIVIASAGNQARDIETAPRYPASFNLNNLISVASTNNSDLLASFSNWGAKHVTVAAPGKDILTTRMGGDYQTISGTSASAAFVAGVAGLVKTLRPWLSAARTRQMILQGARPVPALSDKVAAKGVVNAAGALSTLSTLRPTDGLDGSNGNNGGEHIDNNGNGRSNQREGRPGAGNNSNNNSNPQRDGKEFAVTPLPRTQGAPGMGLPDLDLLRRQQPTSPKAAPPIPSTRCSHRNPQCNQGKRQAALDAPTDFLAWNNSFQIPDFLADHTGGSISDSSPTLKSLLLANSTSSNFGFPLLPQSSSTNLALGKSTTQSSDPGWGGPSSKAVDGNTDGAWADGSVTHTDSNAQAWWQVDLGQVSSIQNIQVWNRVEVPERLSNFYVLVSDNPFTSTDLQATLNQAGVSSYYTAGQGGFPTQIVVNRTGRYVRVQLSGTNYLSLAEVQVFGTAPPTNLALNKVATQSSDPGWGGSPGKAIDGNTDGAWANNSVTHTNNDAQAWWQVDLGTTKSIGTIKVWNRTDCCGDRLSNFFVLVSDSPFQSTSLTATLNQSGVSSYYTVGQGGSPTIITMNPGQTGRFVRVQLTGSNYLSLAEVQVWEGTSDSFSVPRLEANNRTGESGVDLLSGNANWSLPILGLKGRAGLDLGLTLSYNSLVWTKDTASSSMMFDADRGTPSPGFRLGFPVIQSRFYDSQVGKNAYLLISPSGAHVELRQTATSNVYESADSSYLQLLDNGSSLTLKPTDGSQLTYILYNGQYQCTQVKDRNGNYISVSYYSDGRINTVTDTLSRVITFNYDAYLNLNTITQAWGGVTHTWATFGWGDPLTINTSFSGLTVIGPQNNTTIPVLRQVSLDDGLRYNFEYNSSAQVTTVRHYAFDNHQRAYTSYTLPASSNDCPRVTQSHEWAENWNNNLEATTIYTLAADHSSGQVTMPDGTTIYKELFATSGWQRGLTTGTEYWAPNDTTSVSEKKKWTTSVYTQDNTSSTFQQNPRVIEANIYDKEGNHKKTTISYGSGDDSPGSGQYARYGLPYVVREYAADGTTVLRETYMDYKLDTGYVNNRIIGLVSMVHVSNGSAWQSKVVYAYDDGGDQLQATSPAATQHDANYDTGFTTRGNVTSVSRYDVNFITDDNKALTTHIGYDTDGSVIFTRDPLNHQTSLSYIDSFADNVNRQTFAYPTTATDADGYASTVQYNYDFGATTRAQSPAPAGQSAGPIQTMEYDAAGRITRVNNLSNGAWKLWAYPDRQDAVQTLTTINSTSSSNYQISVVDGAGRVRAEGGDLPNSDGLYRGAFTEYDVMGRVSRQSNPAEMTSAWAITGLDAEGWNWTQQQYDWKGRPTLTTLPSTDGVQTSATRLISYGGCGCAGGEVVTLRDEVGRQQRMTADVLGRAYKTEVLNWDGSVYSTVVNTYNARDQLTNSRHYQGTEISPTYQESVLVYDGYGRLLTSKSPEQTSPTSYSYNQDGTTNTVTDARGATATLSYNNRHLVTGISFSAPTGISPALPVAFTYDAAGNRTSMTDSMGSVSYAYDQLSRLTSETRQFNGLSGSFTLSYGYNPGGELTSITDPFGAVVNYSYDKTGRMTDVTGSSFAGVTQYASNAQYRAWGALKALTYGNNRALSIQHNSRLEVSRFDIPGVMTKEYQYDGDGQLHYSQDLRNAKFDRSYAYDQVGRITQALSGVEARGGTSTTGRDRPYNETFQYDRMNHLTARTTQYWDEYHTLSDQYVNDRNTDPAWSYDADGRVLSSPETGYLYDASGNVTSFGDFTEVKTNQRFDGDGRRVRSEEWKFNESAWQSQSVTYYLTSSVLGGAVVTELSSDGAKRRTFVHAGGSILAWQWKGAGGVSDSVEWEHRDASNASFRVTNSAGNVIGEGVASYLEAEPQELDPAGADAGLSAPLYTPVPPEEPVGSLLPYPMMRDPSHPGVTYAIDGIPVSVDSFMSAVESQFASRFDLLAATLRGSTRVVGTRTTTESFTARFSGQSSSGSDDMEAGIVRLGSWDAFAFSFTVTTQTPIYDSSSWSFSLFAGWQSNPQDTVLEHEMGHGKSPCPPTQEQLRRSPIVKRAIKEAFDKADKDAKDFPQIGWIEHGGWIVWNKRTNQLSVLHKEPRTILNSPSSEKYIDTSTQVWLNNPGAPPKGWEFVAAFHIHPDNYLDPDDVSDVPSANHLKAPGIVGLPNGDIVVYGSYNRGIVNGNLPPGCH